MVLFVDIHHENINNNNGPNPYNTIQKCCDTSYQNNQNLSEQWQSYSNHYYYSNYAYPYTYYDGLNNFQAFNQPHIKSEYFDEPFDSRAFEFPIENKFLTGSDERCSKLKQFYEAFVIDEDIIPDENYNGSAQFDWDILPDIPDDILDILMQSIDEFPFLEYKDLITNLMFYERCDDLLYQPTTITNQQPTKFETEESDLSTRPYQKYGKLNISELTMHRSTIKNESKN